MKFSHNSKNRALGSPYSALEKLATTRKIFGKFGEKKFWGWVNGAKKTGSEPLAQSFLAQWPRKKVEILKFNTQGDHSPGNVKFADISRPFVAFIYKCHTYPPPTPKRVFTFFTSYIIVNARCTNTLMILPITIVNTRFVL